MTDETRTLAERIASAFGGLSPKQQRVARYLSEREAEVAFTSATELAKRVEVDPATVVRLARTLGYGGYPDLQRQLRARFPHHYPALAQRLNGTAAGRNAPEIVQRAFQQDLENLQQALEVVDLAAFDAAVEAILAARRILVFGGGVASGAVVFLASSLRTMGFIVSEVTSGGLTLAQEIELLSPADLAVGFSFYRYVRETLTALERLQELGITRIALTDSPVSPAVALSTYALYAPVESTTHRISLVAPLAVVNALLAACATRGGSQVGEALERLNEQYRRAGLLMFD